MLDLNQFTGYTPGPWKWARRYSDGENKPIAVLLETEHRPIKWNDPVVSAIREDWIDMFIDNTPNASLIAAAPELLELCRQQQAEIERLEYLPNGISEALNSGDGVYRP